jgi:proline iminopeptidase
VIGPLLSLRTDDDAVFARIAAARIETMHVNHRFMAEAKAMDLRPRLASVRCPTLVVVGERDPLVPVELAREIVDGVPAGLGRLEIVRDAAHDVARDNPDAFYGVVRAFLAELAWAGARPPRSTNLTSWRAR